MAEKYRKFKEIFENNRFSQCFFVKIGWNTGFLSGNRRFPVAFIPGQPLIQQIVLSSVGHDS